MIGQFYAADVQSIEVNGAVDKVYMSNPTTTALAALTLPTTGLKGHGAAVTIICADLSVGGNYDIEVGTYDPAAGAGSRFTASDTIAVLQSDGPTVSAWVLYLLPPTKAIRITAPGAAFFGYCKIQGQLVQMTL